MSFAKKFFLFFIVAFSMAFIAVIVKLTKSCDCLYSYLFTGITLDPLQTELQWALLRKTIFHISLFIFAHTALVMFSRMFSGRSSPATQQDPAFIKLINRIITNTIEQGIIFLGLFTYFLIDGPVDKLEAPILLNIPSWFILGRVLFSVGYIVGSWINLPQLRTFGFALTVFVNVLLLEYSTMQNPWISQAILSL